MDFRPSKLVKSSPTKSRVRALTAPLLFAFLFFTVPLARTGDVSKSNSTLPRTLDPLVQRYPRPVENALKALKRAMESYDDQRYALALAALPDLAVARTTAVGDFFLLYRAKSNLALDRAGEALSDFRQLQTLYPSSSQIGEAILGECEALLKLHEPAAALAASKNSQLEESADALYLQARAHEEAANTREAVALYLRLYADFVGSKNSLLGFQRLQILSPAAVSPAMNFKVLLQRAENLLRSGKNGDARALLLRLSAAQPTDEGSADKLHLLRGQVEYNLGNTKPAITHLQNVSSKNASLHVQSLYFQGIAYRKLKQEDSFLAMREAAMRLYPESRFTEKLLHSVATYFDVKYQPLPAQEAYKTIAQKFPEGEHAERARWKMALFSYSERRYEEALQGFWDFLLKHPQPDSAGGPIYWMGRCYEKIGDRSRASYLYGRARELANNSYYGLRAQEAEERLKKWSPSNPRSYDGIDFQEVMHAVANLQLTRTAVGEPTPPVAAIIERARQLVLADLEELALAELRSAVRRSPEDRALSFVMARVYEKKDDFYGVIVTLRRAFPNYDVRPPTGLPTEVWRLFYPVRHLDIISSEARKNKIDPALVLGIIRQESAFRPGAHSPANARGLMQVLPTTGRRLAREIRVPRYTTVKLFRPETNIALGTRHLASLLQQFDNKEELALAAYNAGESRVDRWLLEFQNTDMAEFVELIPFSETRGYVKQVLTGKARYRLLTGSPLVTSP